MNSTDVVLPLSLSVILFIISRETSQMDNEEKQVQSILYTYPIDQKNCRF